MPIISADSVETNTYRLALNMGYGSIQNIIVSPDGLYNVYYIKNGICINKTGRILNVVQNRACPKNSYILFDTSEDKTNKKERINFYKVQNIVDITPNDAYTLALKHGFVGTIEDWFESLKGEPGKSAYELAVDAGFEGTVEEYLESLKGESAYQIAVRHGYVGTEDEWLASLQGKDGKDGKDGKSAYDVAVEHGYDGTEEEWYQRQDGVRADVETLNNKVGDVEKHLEWIPSMENN